jgi:ABC-type glycerol-3-phosphate transport system permease component
VPELRAARPRLLGASVTSRDHAPTARGVDPVVHHLRAAGLFSPLVLPEFLATDAFFAFLMVQFIRGLPRELDEAATVDDCGPTRTFRYIIATSTGTGSSTGGTSSPGSGCRIVLQLHVGG